MNTSIRRLLAASIATGFASAITIGAAQAETKTYDFSGFTSVDAAVGVEVEVSVGGDYSVRAEGDAEDLERLRIRHRGDTLDIDRTQKNGWFQVNRRGDFTVFVTMPSLEEVNVSSGAGVTATAINADRFKVSVSSGADASLSGECETLDAEGSSGADLDARDLRCVNATVSVSTGADMTVYASESVEAKASTGGDVTVYGDPGRKQINRSLGGDVSVRN